MRRQRILPLLLAAVAVFGSDVWSRRVSAQTSLHKVPLLAYNPMVKLGVCPIRFQTGYIPYYGKNRVRHTPFEWYIYKTDHFDMYYYPALEQHLVRIASFAESAYQRISGELKHDLPDRVPIILFKTQSEFQTQNIAGVELPEGVLAFAEPERNRMVFPIDEPDDQLYRLITHELTHVFEFAIIPRGIMGANVPLWMDEGLANYMAGYWNTLDLMQVRDAALTDNVPKMSEFEAMALSGRLPYSMGHATFEFIESKWGKEGVRQFLFSLRKSAIGGGESAYEEALKVKPEDFDDQFDRYLKDRFKPFRDKERPADYGRNLAPKPRMAPDLVTTLTVEPSPSGEMLAAVVGNRRDQELDIVLLSARDGQVLTNLTKGFDKDRGFEYIGSSGGLRGNLVPWISWAPVGDRIAYFARTEKEKTLIIHNIISGQIERRFPMKTVDSPESPSFSPDGKSVAFSALQNAITDIFTIDISTGAITNVTKDEISDYAPAFAPDGRTIVYSARIASNDKLFQLDLANGQRRQLTFGTHDDVGAKFYDVNTIVFASTAVDPKSPLGPELAKNGNIPNIWSLNIKTSELRQMTDTVTGNLSPAILREGPTMRVAFVAYYKGENTVHAIDGDKVVTTAVTSDFGAPDIILPFQPPLTHTLLRDNIHKKGTFEKMTLAGRPPVNLGVTTGGNFYGNTQITFTDVLGDKQINFYAESFQQYRTTALSYTNIEGRIQYAIQGFSQDRFFYGQYENYLYDPSLAPYIDRDLAEAVSSQKGGTAFAIYPFNRYTRVELFGGYVKMTEEYRNTGLQELAAQYQTETLGRPVFRSGHMMPLGVALVQETTVFREYGPVSGSTMRIAFDASPGIRETWLSRRTLDVDARHYIRMVANGVFAVRFKGLKSWGPNPDFMTFGGNSEMRGYEYLSFLGHKAFFANAELRFPLIEAMLTPVGVLGGLRGVFFANIGGAGFAGLPFNFMKSSSEIYTPVIGYDNFFGTLIPVFGPPVEIDGMRLIDGRASYGIGLESFLLGFPMHFDWSWKTLLNKQWEDAYFAAYGGSSAFRKVKFAFWIGYDF